MGEEVNHIQKILIFAAMKPWLHILLSCFLLVACAKHEAPPPEEDVLYRIEQFYQPKPDSAARILDTLDISVLSEKERAHYCLLKARTNQLQWKVGAETDSLLHEAENYFANGKDQFLEAITYWTISLDALMTRKGVKFVLDYQLKALQSIECCRHVDERFVSYSPKPTTEQNVIDNIKYSITMRLGMAYAESHYYWESIRYLKPTEAFFYDNHLYTMHTTTAYGLGLSYMRLNEPDSSFKYFERGYLSAEKRGNREDMALYHSLLARLYKNMLENHLYEDDTEAKTLLLKAVAESKKSLDILGDTLTKYKSDVMDVLAYAYCELHQYDSCIYYAKQVYEMPRSLWKSEAAHYLYQSYLALGDNEKALHYVNLYLGMDHDDVSEMMAVAKVKEEYDLKMELQNKDNEHQMKRMRLYLLISLQFIALLLTLLFVSRYRKNKEIEVLRLREAQRLLEVELGQITGQQKEMLQQRVMVIYQSRVKDRLQRILDEFEAAYPKAVERLKAACPNLNETERRIIVLSFLQFRVKEEADLLGLTENTAQKYRSNIKKKVGFDPISALAD